MIRPELPPDEHERVHELHSYGILDTDVESDFEAIIDLVLAITGSSMAAISFIDSDRQWYKASRNIRMPEIPREISFCAHGILNDDLMVVTDARNDERFKDDPLVTGEPGVRFYAGAPLVTADGHRLGMLCVQDSRPRSIDDVQRMTLRNLAALTVRLLELRRERQRALELQKSIEHREHNTLQFFASLLSLYTAKMPEPGTKQPAWLMRFHDRLIVTGHLLRASNRLSGMERLSTTTDIAPVVTSMFSAGNTYNDPSARLPIEMDDVALPREAGLTLASLLDELVVTLHEASDSSGEPTGTLTDKHGEIVLQMSAPVSTEAYTALHESVHLPVIESLCGRLSGDFKVLHTGEELTIVCTFPITVRQ